MTNGRGDKTGTLDPRVRELLQRFNKAVGPLRAAYAVGGALAMHAHGVRRETTDVDAFIAEKDRARVLQALRGEGFSIATIAAPFHYAAYIPAHADLDYRVDVLFPAGEPEASGIQTAVDGRVEDIPVRVFTVEMLVLAKFYSDQVKDRLDIALMYFAGLFEPGTIRCLLSNWDCERVPEWDSLIEEVGRPRKSRPRPAGPLKK